MANIRIQGIAETGTGEDPCAKVLEVISMSIDIQPSLSENDIMRRRRTPEKYPIFGNTESADVKYSVSTQMNSSHGY